MAKRFHEFITGREKLDVEAEADTLEEDEETAEQINILATSSHR